MKRHLLRAIRFLLTAVLLISVWACGGDDAADCEHRLEAQRAEQRREVARLWTELSRRELEARGHEANYRGAVLIWGGTAAALLVAILLLARQRRGRRVVDRLLRMILHRARGARCPSHEP